MKHILLNNFETFKLVTDNIELSNLHIFTILIGISILTLKKRESDFLDKTQTDQLKGIGILCVIVGHLWVHVTQSRPSIVLSGDAVGLFFLLSGFGLSISSSKKIPSLRYYLSKRMTRVMIPYWFATITILLLDFYIIGRSYQRNDLIMTFLGINFNESTRYIDYVRWYITLLLVWYILFFLYIKKSNNNMGLVLLFIFSVTIFIFQYYFGLLGWHQVFAFPVGCVIGKHYHYFKNAFNQHYQIIPILLVFLILPFIFFKITLSSYTPSFIPSISWKFIKEIISLSFSAWLVLVIAFKKTKKYYSSFLLFVGTYSYDIFLLHGAFLIKYNPIINNGKTTTLPAQLTVFILVITLLSILFMKSYRRLIN